VDSRGLWIDVDMSYRGNFCLTLETKINLLKLGKTSTNEDKHELDAEGDDGPEENFGVDSGKEEGMMVRNLYDSDAEESGGESSEEESDTTETQLAESRNHDKPDQSQPHKRTKIMRVVEKVEHAAANFASHLHFMKGAFGKVGITSVVVTVEVNLANGTITLNIPAPPTNRLWIAFRAKPELELIVSPTLGEQSMNLNPLTDWIKEKLQEEIQVTRE